LKREMLHPKFAEKIKTQILFLITLFPKKIITNSFRISFLLWEPEGHRWQ